MEDGAQRFELWEPRKADARLQSFPSPLRLDWTTAIGRKVARRHQTGDRGDGAVPLSIDEAALDGLSIDEAAPDDVAASDLRAVQRAIASCRWRENSQAKKWVGHAVAEVMGLDVANKAHTAKIVELLKTWIANGMLVVEGEVEQRKKRRFVEVGPAAE